MVADLRIPDLESFKASLAKDSLPDFFREAWPIVEPTTPLSWNWHLDELCDVLTQVSLGKIKRIIINIPPGFSKSLLVSVMWPAWEWASNPSLRYLTFSYSDANTIRDNRRVRSIVTSDWYKRHYGLQLSPDSQGKIRFDTTAQGWRIASSVGGTGTGEHPDRIIVDDALKANDARSEVSLFGVNSWFDDTVSTRVARDPAIININQRLHMSDLTAHLLSKGGFELVCFPMRFDPLADPKTLDHPPVDPRDRRTDVGELLWPKQWPEEKVRQEEILLGPFGSASQLQQSPVPEGGGLFKRDYFPIVDAAPANARRARGWDTADTEGQLDSSGQMSAQGNWTVGIRMSELDGIFYVEDAVRIKEGPGKVNATIFQTSRLDGKNCMIREGSGSGKATIAARTKMLAGWDYGPSPETEDKVTRANPFRAQAEAGNVRMVRGEWNEAYLSVMCSFPVGKYDDDVDASANAFNALVTSEPGVRSVKVTWGKKSTRNR